jgi:hypothetical protein
MRFRRACASVEGRSIDGQNHISSNGESFKPGLARERFELRDRHGRIGYEGDVMHAEIVERPPRIRYTATAGSDQITDSKVC